MLIVQGLSIVLFSKEHVTILEQKRNRWKRLKRFMDSHTSARSYRLLGVFQLALGVVMLVGNTVLES